MLRISFLTRDLVLFQEVPPSWSRRGATPSMPLYFWIRSSRERGRRRRLPVA